MVCTPMHLSCSSGLVSSWLCLQRMPDFLPIEFIIIGGGVAGLTSAIALSRVGHQVTLLEVDPTFKEVRRRTLALRSHRDDHLCAF